MNTEQRERDAFEAWAKDENLPIWHEPLDHSIYEQFTTQKAWAAWQARGRILSVIWQVPAAPTPPSGEVEGLERRLKANAFGAKRCSESARADVNEQIALDAIAALRRVSAGKVPDGWKLVPVEPTAAMLFAAIGWREQDQCADLGGEADQFDRVYRAMLAATPDAGKVPTQGEKSYWLIERKDAQYGGNLTGEWFTWEGRRGKENRGKWFPAWTRNAQHAVRFADANTAHFMVGVWLEYLHDSHAAITEHQDCSDAPQGEQKEKP